MKIAFRIIPAQRDASIQEQESSIVSSKLVGARTTEYRRFARVCPRFSNKHPLFAAFFGSASDCSTVFLADHSGSPPLAPHRCGNSSKPGAEGVDVVAGELNGNAQAIGGGLNAPVILLQVDVEFAQRDGFHVMHGQMREVDFLCTQFKALFNAALPTSFSPF